MSAPASTCCFAADTRAPGVHACGRPATHRVQDRRPLPDGQMRPPMPSCKEHALGLLAASPTAYIISFPILIGGAR